MKRKLSKILGIGISIALVTSLLVAAVPAVALTQPTVTVSPSTISEEDADYVIIFDINKMLTENGTITITFPAGTDVTGVGGAIIAATDGWDTSNASDPKYLAANLSDVDWDYSNTYGTVTAELGVDDFIGEGAQVRIALPNGIQNPGTPGMYTLTVKTSAETTAVTSAEYEITTPIIDPLSGIVQAFNSEGILMMQSHSIQACINAAGEDGTVEVGPGTYTEPEYSDQIDADVDGQTIIGIGEAGTVIVKPPLGLLVTGDDVTLDGITFSPGGADQLVDVSGDRAIVTNCEFSAGTTYSPAVIELLWTTGANTTISNSSFDTTKTGEQTGIEIDAGKAEVTDCIFNVNSTDEAIDVMGDTDISGVTITGSSGTGVYVECGKVVTIDDSSFMSLTNAVVNDSGTVTMTNSVVDGCTGDAISGSGTLRMYNCTIQNTDETEYAFNLGGGADAEVHFNNILNNTLNVKAVSTANFSHNWWGSADGPAFGSNDGPVNTAPALGNSVVAAGMTVGGTSLTAKDTVGMDVKMLEGSPYIIGVAKYSANPELAPPTIMGTGSVLGYYDLYVGGAGVNDVVQVKFYVPVTPYTKIYYAGGISGRWSDAGGDVNLASGFAYVTVGGVDAGLQVEDLGGTVFAVVEDKATDVGPVANSPAIGSYDVAIEPMFTWDGVPGSIRYEIALSEDPTFTIIEWSYNVDQTFYKVDEPLRYDTTYYWRVRGVLGEPYQEFGQWKTPATPWTTSIFTTASEPEPPPDPIVVQPTKPEVNVEIPPTKITIEPAEQAIPNYMLWIIVAVGAILVIALIVLIVRTRRVV
jgi:hypothetical protein